MEIQEILESLEKGKISSNTAKKMLSLYSIEEIEGIAKIDINRRKRKGIPEVIFAEAKSLDEIKKILKITIGKTNSVVISRIKKEDYSKIISFCKRLKIKIKEGEKASTRSSLCVSKLSFATKMFIIKNLKLKISNHQAYH